MGWKPYRKYVFFPAFLLLLSLHPNAQPAIPKLFQNLIPAGYFVLDSTSGDLNRDLYKDLVVILKSGAEESNPDAARPLLLLAGGPGGYELLERNDSVVLCKGCGGIFGDPYAGITIKNGYFSVEHYGGSNWRWARIITFKYDVKTRCFKLHRDAGTSYHTSDPNKVTDIFSNKKDWGQLLFKDYSCNKDF